MKSLVALATAAVLIAVAGCSTLPSGGNDLPPSGGALPPPDASVGPAGVPEASDNSGDYSGEQGAVESIAPEAPAAAPSAVLIPEAKGWTNPDVPLSQRQADMEACYDFATAQVARESQIDEDRYQAQGGMTDYQSLSNVNRQIDYYSQKRRRGALFDSCMRSKGYIRS